MPRSVIATSAPPGTAPIRKLIVRVTIGSFSLAALLGIIALLRGGEFGQTQFRVLLTTLLVGVVSIAVLCYLATAGRPSQPVGVAGGVIVLVPLVTALLMIWGDVEHGPSEGIRKTFGIGTAVAATLAQASLLLTLGERARPGVRRILDGTLALAAVLAAMTSALIAGFYPGRGRLLPPDPRGRGHPRRAGHRGRGGPHEVRQWGSRARPRRRPPPQRPGRERG